MMATLDNTRHERFAQELAKGKPAVTAYKEAGYSADTAESNAYRLMENEGVKARVQELQAAAAQDTRMTIERITEQLMEDRRAALDQKQVAAAVQADRAMARIHGLDVERVEATHRTITDNPMQPEDWAAKYATDKPQDDDTAPDAVH